VQIGTVDEFHASPNPGDRKIMPWTWLRT
jgi:hypothetical protein